MPLTAWRLTTAIDTSEPPQRWQWSLPWIAVLIKLFPHCTLTFMPAGPGIVSATAHGQTLFSCSTFPCLAIFLIFLPSLPPIVDLDRLHVCFVVSFAPQDSLTSFAFISLSAIAHTLSAFTHNAVTNSCCNTPLTATIFAHSRCLWNDCTTSTLLCPRHFHVPQQSPATHHCCHCHHMHESHALVPVARPPPPHCFATSLVFFNSVHVWLPNLIPWSSWVGNSVQLTWGIFLSGITLGLRLQFQLNPARLKLWHLSV